MLGSASSGKKRLPRLAGIAAALLLAAGVACADEALPPIWQMVEKRPPGPLPGEPVLGKADTPLTIIEYASLTCPHCARFATQTLPKLKQEWIDTGKAKLVFRDFPLDGLALRAAALTHCVPPERYLEFVDTLFKEQPSWIVLGDKAIARIASLGGLSEAQAEACLADTNRVESISAARAAAAKEWGVDATPTFFIESMKISGAYPYVDPENKDRDFKSALAAALAQKQPSDAH
jgi:protein-disulfide isomerase